jgi:parallel beta-helix repeat protein
MKPYLYNWGDPLGAGTADMYLSFVTYADGHMAFYKGNGATWGSGVVTSAGTLVDGTWYHIVGTANGTHIDLFIDGQSEGAVANSYSVDEVINIGSRYPDLYPFHGTVDDVRIWNRTLTPEQIQLLYENRTDMISFNETSIGDVWHSCVTPNDGTEDGVENCSNTLEIVNAVPEAFDVVLNSTYGTNYSNENLTVYWNVSDVDGDNVTNVTNWYLNGTSIMVLNMPFEAHDVNDSSEDVWTKDYTNFSNNGSVISATWNSTGGYDGWGAYEFDGSNSAILVPDNEGLRLQDGTWMAWIRLNSYSTSAQSILSKDASGLNYGDGHLLIEDSADTYPNKVRFYTSSGATSYDIYSNSVFPLNTYTHVAVIYGSSGLKMYINGVEQTDTDSSTVPVNGSENVVIGASYAFSLNFNGTIDDVRIYNRSLSVDQIQLLYENRTDMMHFDETSIGDVWQACITPNDGTEDGVENCSNTLQIAINNPRIENVVLNSTYGTNYTGENLTVYYDSLNDAGLDNKNITNWYLNGTSITAVNMPFEITGGSNETSWAKDYSNNSNHGTVNSASWYPTGGHDGGGAYRFDNSDYINVPDDPTLDITDAITLAAWVKYDSVGQYDRIVGKFLTSCAYPWRLYGLELSVSNKFCIVTSTSGGTDKGCLPSTTTATVGPWYHVVGTFNGTHRRIYINGTQQNQAIDSYSFATNNQPFEIGRDNAQCGEQMNGYIDDVRVYNKSLSPDQVKLLYEGRDDRIHFNDTAAGDVWQACITPNDGVEEGAENCSNTLAVEPNTIEACEIIIVPGTYTLEADIEHDNLGGAITTNVPDVDYACISIRSNDVTFDCQGHSIAFNGTQDEVAIVVERNDLSNMDNVVIRNCAIQQNYRYGVYLYNTTNSRVEDVSHTNATRGMRVQLSSGITVDDVTVNDATTYSFININVTDSSFSNLAATDNLRGFYLYGSSRNNVTNVTASNNTNYGFYLSDGSENNTLTNVTGYMGAYGLFIRNSSGTEVDVSRFYDNGYDFGIDNTLSSSIIYNFSNVLFLNPAGSVVNYTNLSVDDSVAASSEYNINWSSNISALPANRGSVNETYVNISVSSGTVSIDEITWHWDAGQGINENQFELWNYNSSGWTSLNSTPDTSANELSLVSHSPNGTYALLELLNQAPLASDVVLNSTYGTNYSTENLTVYWTVSDSDSDNVTNVTNWYLNGTSIMVLNMPFEATGGNESGWAKDYSNFSNHAEMTGSNATWNEAYGHDGWGAYDFDGNKDSMRVPDSDSLDINTSWTISARFNPDGLVPDNSEFWILKGSSDGQRAYGIGRLSTEAAFCWISPDGTQANRAYVMTTTQLTNTNKWYHVVCMFDGASQDLTLYLDGADETNAGAGTIPAYTHSSTEDLFIGSSFSPNHHPDGVLDQLIIFNRTLTPDQVQLLYQNRTDMIHFNETSIGDVWQACITPNDGTEDGDENCSNTLEVVNAVPQAFDVVLNSTYGTNYTTENLTVYWNVSDSDGDNITNITNWYVNGTSIAVLNMPFESTGGNESSWTKDYTNNSNHATSISGATWNSTGGHDGFGAYYFNGDDYINVDGSDFNFGTGDFSISLWVNGDYVNHGSVWNAIVARDEIVGTPASFFGLYILSSNNVSFVVNDDNYLATSTSTIDSPGMHHVVGVREGDDLRIYFNGVHEGSGTTSGSVSDSNVFRIGRDPSAFRYFTGTIDDVSVYNRSLTHDQILLLYNNRSDRIHFNETSVGDVWEACVTPNDGYEDGEENCSNTLEVVAPALFVTEVDPLDAWVLNDTIKFECNASTSNSLLNGSLWHNYSGTLSMASYQTLSGTDAEFEFNESGFTNEVTFDWYCQACDSTETCEISENRTITIDLTRPLIDFELPTPANNVRNSTVYNWAYVNVSTSDTYNRSAFVDWNRSLVGWWRLENSTGTSFVDSSTYGNDGTCSGTECPELWTGPRGKAYNYDGSDMILVLYNESLKLGNQGTLSLWTKPSTVESGTHVLMSYSGPAGYSDGFLINQLGSNLAIYWSQAAPGINLGSALTAGEWTHIVVVNNGGTMTLYQDGEYKTQAGTGGAITEDGNVTIGGRELGGWRFNGTIDEAMIWNRPLSAAEVNATYRNQLHALERNFTGLPSGRVNYTAYVVDMAGNLNQTEYRNFSVNYVPNVTNMELNSTYNTNYTTENLTVWYDSADGDSDVVKNITNWYLEGLSIMVLNMPFESNGDLNMSSWTKDYTSFSNDGVVTDAVWNSTGGYDGRGAYEFDGDKDLVLVEHDNSLNIGDQGFAFAMWLKPGATMDAGARALEKNGLYAVLVYASNYHIYLYNSTGSGKVTTTNAGTKTTDWTHLAFSVDSNNVTSAYVNGTLQTDSETIPDLRRSVGTWVLRMGNSSVTGDRDYNGTIDDVRIFNRSLTADQVQALYQNKTDVIVSQETEVGDDWHACVTPHDGIEDGTALCSATLTIEASAILAQAVDPLDGWVLNDTIKFECSASSDIALLNGSIWHNYSGSWALADYVSLSGTSADYEFNLSGFDTEKYFGWYCKACDAGECDLSSNRFMDIDVTEPNIDLVDQTPANNVRNSTVYNWAYVNVSVSGSGGTNRSAFIDWNQSLRAWMRFENDTIDYSSFIHDGSCSGTQCPELWTGTRGKGYKFDGVDDRIELDDDDSLNITNETTLEAWFYPGDEPGGALYDSIVTRGGLWDYGSSYQLYYDSNTDTVRSYMRWGTGQYNHTNVQTAVAQDQWIYAAVTCNATGAVRLYIDGDLRSSNNMPSGKSLQNSSLATWIGGSSDGSTRWFNGTIDEVRIWSRVLSPEEINASYRNQLYDLKTNFTGIGSGTWNYTAYVVDMAGNLNQTEYRNYSVNWLPNVSNLVIDGSGDNNDTTENISITFDTADGDGDVVKNITNWYLNGSSILALNMPFEPSGGMNMGSWTKDYSVADNHGTTFGDPEWNSTGGFDGWGAYELDGTDQHIRTSTTGFPDEAFDEMSVTMWVKTANTVQGNKYIFHYGLCTGHNQFSIVQNSGGSILFSNCNANGDLRSNLSLTADTWTHLAFVYNGTHKMLYWNGTLDNSTSYSLFSVSDTFMHIGSYEGTANFWNGTVDELQVWNRSLSAEQVLALSRNRTDLIVSQELSGSETWQACVTPNDGIEDGTIECSDELDVELFTYCRQITSSGAYTLAGNATGAPKPTIAPQVGSACVVINSSDVDFSCNGSTIINDGTSDAAAIVIDGTTLLDFTNVTIHDCPSIEGYKVGIFISETEKDYIQNVTVHDNTRDGIFISNSDECLVTNTTARSNDLYGFRISGGSANNITNNTAYNNTLYGFVMAQDASNSKMMYNLAYNNTYDVLANNTQGQSAYTFNLTEFEFRNYSGTTNNRTILSLYDTLEIGDEYTIKWSENTTNIPEELGTDITRIVEITPIGGAELDSVAWHWLESEVQDAFEQKFEVWRYYAGWERLDATVDTDTNTINVSNLLPQSPHGVVENKTNRNPIVNTLILNATDKPLNRTTANLTSWATTSDEDNEDIKLYYNWYLNGTSITVLNLLMSYDAQKSDDGETVLDISGYLNNATLGAPGPAGSDEPHFDKNGVYKGFGAYEFDGSDYMNVSHDSTLAMDDNSFTIEMWVRSDDAANPSSIEGLLYKRDGSAGYNIYFNTDGRIAFYYRNSSTVRGTDYASDLYDDAWHHIAVVRDVEDDTISLYTDGQYRLQTAGISAGLGNTADMYIGSQLVGTNQEFDGFIADVVIYNLSLTADQIENDFESGIGRHNFTVSNETTKHDVWNVSATPVDLRGAAGDTAYSEGLTVRNTPPTQSSLIWPNDNNDTLMTRNPALNWSSVFDADNDAVSFRINVSNTLCDPEISYTGVTDSNKTIEAADELNTTDECNEWYNWTVEPYDGEEYGPVSVKWNFKVMPIILLYLAPFEIDFQDMILGQTDDTSDGVPEPYVLENNGTVIADIMNITADADLWERQPSPSRYFQVQVDDNETGSINLSGSATEWTNVSTANFTIIDSLHYRDIYDAARIDFAVEVPLDEPPGEKSVQLTFYGAQT